jgi:hypothetical protein
MIANSINNTKEDGKLEAQSIIEVILALVDSRIVADRAFNRHAKNVAWRIQS